MFDKKSDYALNKLNPDAIVCKSVTGVHIKLRREDFASEEEFRYWKETSDSDYQETELAGRGFYDYCISMDEVRNSSGISTEGAFFAPMLNAEQKEQRPALLQQIKNKLTEKQFRRLCLYYLEGKTEAQIAELGNL